MPSLSRFLVEDIVKDERPVPTDIAPLYILFYKTFVKRDSKFEVNIPDGLRKAVKEEVNGLLRVCAFDEVVMHVIALLYVNSFAEFVKNGAK